MKLIIILSILFINKATALKSSDLCKNTEQECTGEYDNYFRYNVNCNQLECTGIYKYSCLNEYCTINNATCYKLVNIHKKLIFINDLPERIIKFEKSIKQCHKITENKIDLNNDVCITGRNCYLVSRSSKFSKFYTKNSNVSISCPCNKGKYGYHCGNSFCTTNSIVCEQIMEKMNQTTNLSFQKCFNDNQIIKRNKPNIYFNKISI